MRTQWSRTQSQAVIISTQAERLAFKRLMSSPSFEKAFWLPILQQDVQWFFFFWHWCPKFWKDKCIKNLNTGKAITQWHLITLMQWDYRISTVMQSSTPVPFQWLENSWPINVRILLQLGWGRPEGSRCKTRRLFLYRWMPPLSPPFSRMTPKRRHWVLLCLLPGRCRSITSQPLALNGHVEFWFSGVWIYLNAGV